MTLAAGATTIATARTSSASVDKALETLKTYDWGSDRNALNPIDQAIVAAQGNTIALKPLEKGLLDALTTGISRSAQDYVCRKLRTIGTSQSIEALAALLPAEETSHIARFALERIPKPKATRAIRDALPKVRTKLKPGLIGSLGVRRDKKSIKIIAKFLGDSDVETARAAAQSLGLIGTSAAAKELSRFIKEASACMKIPVADACLVCAKQLLSDGKKSEAIALYKELQGNNLPSHIKAAAMKGILTVTTRK